MGKIYNLFEQSIDEAFIGKTDTLLQVEEQFNIMKKTLKRGQDLNSRPEVQKLNRLIEKQFGMDIFSLRIDASNVVNAYTEIIATKFDIGLENDIRKLVEGSQDSGYRFKKNNHLCIVTTIYLGLILKENMSGEELTGVLLHELGHNFADALDDKIRLANKKITKNYYNYLIWRASTIFGRKYKKELEKNTSKAASKESEKESRKNVLRGWIRGLAAIKYNFNSFCGEVLGRLASAGYSKVEVTNNEKKNKGKEASESADRRNEVFADKFCAVYGYANAQARALYKIDTNESKAYKFIDKISKSINDNFEQLIQNYYLYDEHPQTIQRVNAMMNTLKAELAKEDLDPTVKKVLEDQLNQMNEFIKEITVATKNDTEREAVRKAFYKTVNENAPDAMAKALEDEIEKALDEGLKKL